MKRKHIEKCIRSMLLNFFYIKQKFFFSPLCIMAFIVLKSLNSLLVRVICSLSGWDGPGMLLKKVNQPPYTSSLRFRTKLPRSHTVFLSRRASSAFELLFPYYRHLQYLIGICNSLYVPGSHLDVPKKGTSSNIRELQISISYTNINIQGLAFPRHCQSVGTEIQSSYNFFFVLEFLSPQVLLYDGQYIPNISHFKRWQLMGNPIDEISLNSIKRNLRYVDFCQITFFRRLVLHGSFLSIMSAYILPGFVLSMLT